MRLEVNPSPDPNVTTPPTATITITDTLTTAIKRSLPFILVLPTICHWLRIANRFVQQLADSNVAGFIDDELFYAGLAQVSIRRPERQLNVVVVVASYGAQNFPTSRTPS